MTCWLKGSIPTGFYSWLYASHAHDCTVAALLWKKGLFSLAQHREMESVRFSTSSEVPSFKLESLSSVIVRQESFAFQKMFSLYFGCLLCAKICGNFSLTEPAWASYGIQCSPSYSCATTARDLGWRGQEERDRGMIWSSKPGLPASTCQQALQWCWRYAAPERSCCSRSALVCPSAPVTSHREYPQPHHWHRNHCVSCYKLSADLSIWCYLRSLPDRIASISIVSIGLGFWQQCLYSLEGVLFLLFMRLFSTCISGEGEGGSPLQVWAAAC